MTEWLYYHGLVLEAFGTFAPASLLCVTDLR